MTRLCVTYYDVFLHLFFDTLDDNGWIFPGQPSEEGWNSHDNSIGKTSDF